MFNQYCQFFEPLDGDGDSGSAKPVAAPGGQGGGKNRESEDGLNKKYEEAMAKLQEEKEEHEKLKAHSRQISVNFESHMLAFEGIVIDLKKKTQAINIELN